MAIDRDQTWFVYLLRDPRDNAIRYVGWTLLAPDERLREHLRERQRNNRHHRARWIKCLARLQLAPTIHVVQRGRGDGWADAERKWIARCRADGCDLVNGTDGGEGVPGHRHSEETRRRLSEIMRGREVPALQGRPLSAEHREKLAAAKRGRPQTPEHIAARAAAVVGSTRSLETRAKMSAAQKARGSRPKHSEETKAKMSASHRARGPKSEETRARMSAAQRARFKDRW